jgi:hypothetical protein
MPISGSGWELIVRRFTEQKVSPKVRTYGTYQVFVEGTAKPSLMGYICEARGPGDNNTPGNGRRIEPGSYPLWTQYGKYRSQGYVTGSTTPGAVPMPGFGLRATGNRTAILVHPAHPPGLFLSSVGCFNPTAPLVGASPMEFWDSRQRVVDLLDSLRSYDPDAFGSETARRIRNARMIVEGEPTGDSILPSQESLKALKTHAGPPVLHEPVDLPISASATRLCAEWLTNNFGDALRQTTSGRPYGVKHLCAIVCQETAYKWVPWIGKHGVDTIVGRAVYDASGDYPGAPRRAFPQNTAAFRTRYGDVLTDMLIEEANKTRRLQGYGDKPWVYKGYGLFQYDLQHITQDEAFFRDRKWHSMTECLKRVRQELDLKLQATNNDLWKAIRAYNGSGPAAENYMRNVKAFTAYCAEVVGE